MVWLGSVTCNKKKLLINWIINKLKLLIWQITLVFNCYLKTQGCGWIFQSLLIYFLENKIIYMLLFFLLKTECCSSETMVTESFSSLLFKPSFHSEWTEPEIYYSPKLSGKYFYWHWFFTMKLHKNSQSLKYALYIV